MRCLLCVVAISFVTNAAVAELDGVLLLQNAPPAIPLTRNSHATAAAWLARYLGAQRADESDSTLVGSAWVYLSSCPTCDGGASQWDITGGLRAMLRERGVGSAVVERYRSSSNRTQVATMEDVAAALNAGRPAIVTFCASRSAIIPAVAAQRANNCFSAVVIGVARVGESWGLIARDGLVDAGDRQADQFLLQAADVPAGTEEVLAQPGTHLYAWDTGNTNLVLTMVDVHESDRP